MDVPGGETSFLRALDRLSTPKGQEALELAVIANFFSRIDGYPYASELRRHFESATPVSRKMTGVGFYLDFHVPDDAPPLSGYPEGPGPTHLDTVRFTRTDEIGWFVLWFDAGRVSSLEGFTTDQWPADVSEFEVLNS